MDSTCVICGCRIHRGGEEYGRPTIEGRSHASEHHYVAERFFGRSATRKDEPPRERIFKNCPWAGMEGKSDVFCFECGEELLHDPVLLPTDIDGFAELVRLRGLNESEKPENKDKMAGRIVLLHEVIEKGIKATLAEK